jgi:hypothetical protein
MGMVSTLSAQRGYVPGLGDTHDPSCPWYCSSFCSGFGPPPGRTTCLGLDCTACQCASNQVWNPATLSCVSTSLAVTPVAPTMSACSASDPGATVSGQDSTGNPTYVCASTAAADQAATLAAQTAAAQLAAEAADAANAVNCSSGYEQLFSPACTPDCTTTINSLFASGCGGSLVNLVLAVGVGVLAVTFMMNKK